MHVANYLFLGPNVKGPSKTKNETDPNCVSQVNLALVWLVAYVVSVRGTQRREGSNKYGALWSLPMFRRNL